MKRDYTLFESEKRSPELSIWAILVRYHAKIFLNFKYPNFMDDYSSFCYFIYQEGL